MSQFYPVKLTERSGCAACRPARTIGASWRADHRCGRAPDPISRSDATNPLRCRTLLRRFHPLSSRSFRASTVVVRDAFFVRVEPDSLGEQINRVLESNAGCRPATDGQGTYGVLGRVASLLTCLRSLFRGSHVLPTHTAAQLAQYR